MSVRWLCYRILAAGPLAACSSNSPPSTAAAGRVPTADPKRSPHAGRRVTRVTGVTRFPVSPVVLGVY